MIDDKIEEKKNFKAVAENKKESKEFDDDVKKILMFLLRKES